MIIAMGSDHAGLETKKYLKNFILSHTKNTILEFGCNSSESVDYPDYAKMVAEAVRDGKADRGILICGTGIGMCIVANKIKGIRAAVCNDTFSAELSRSHNNTNVLSIGGRIIGTELAKEIVHKWLTTPYDSGRHQQRIEKITEIENEW